MSYVNRKINSREEAPSHCHTICKTSTYRILIQVQKLGFHGTCHRGGCRHRHYNAKKKKFHLSIISKQFELIKMSNTNIYYLLTLSKHIKCPRCTNVHTHVIHSIDIWHIIRINQSNNNEQLYAVFQMPNR